MPSKPDTIMVYRLDLIGSPSLFPADAAAAEAIGKLVKDESVEIRIVRDRSLPQHRLFWSVLDHVAKNSQWESADRLLVALKIRLGKYDLCRLPNGKAVPVPQSISFAKMDQGEFQDFMDRSIAVICEETLGGYDSERLIREAQGMVPA